RLHSRRRRGRHRDRRRGDPAARARARGRADCRRLRAHRHDDAALRHDGVVAGGRAQRDHRQPRSPRRRDVHARGGRAGEHPRRMGPPGGMLAEWETLLALTAIVAGQGPDADLEALDDLIAAEVGRLNGVEPDVALRGPERLLDMMLRAGPYKLTLADLKAAPHGIDLGPLEPRLPEVLRTPSGLVELAPAQVVGDVPRLQAAMAEHVNGGMVLVGRRDLRSNNSWMHNLPLLVSGPERCTA